MDYLQTTGDRLHDLELDRILARLRTLETSGSSVSTITPAAVQTTVTSVVAGVRSITPGTGTQMSNDIVLAVSGPLTIAQATNTITLTAQTLAAGSNITLTTVGTTTTIAASGGGGSSLASNVLIVSANGGTVAWVTPASVTELYGTLINRAKFDGTHATQARLTISNPNVSPLVKPTVAAQYSSNGGSTWAYLDGSAGPSLTFDANFIDSGWVTLAAGAQADVLFRIVGLNGNGSATHNYGTIILQVK